MKVYLFTIVFIINFSVVYAEQPQWLDMPNYQWQYNFQKSGQPSQDASNNEQPQQQMTPANHARQQIPRYPQYPVWGYQTHMPVGRVHPVQVWQRQRNVYQEVAMIYNLRESTADYNRRKLAEIAARQAIENAQKQEKSVVREVTPVPVATPQKLQIQAFSVSHSVSSPASFTLPPWFYEVLGWVIFGISVTVFVLWGMNIFLLA